MLSNYVRLCNQSCNNKILQCLIQHLFEYKNQDFFWVLLRIYSIYRRMITCRFHLSIAALAGRSFSYSRFQAIVTSFNSINPHILSNLHCSDFTLQYYILCLLYQTKLFLKCLHQRHPWIQDNQATLTYVFI